MRYRVERMLLSRATSLGCLLAVGILVTPTPGMAKGEKVSELYRANAMVPGVIGPDASALVDIKVSRYSTEEEEERLALALKSQGPQGLFKEMKRQQKTGFLAIRGERGYPTYYTREVRTDGNREIWILTDREIFFEEVYNREITMQFPFTMITMMLDEEGNGEGTAILGAELKWDEAKDVLRITGYSAEPIRLEGIRLIKKK